MIQVRDTNGKLIEDIRKTEHGSLVVDNQSEYQQYLKHKEQMQKVNQNQKDIESMKDDLSVIKSLLNKLLENKE